MADKIEKKDIWWWIKVINGTIKEETIEDFENEIQRSYDIWMMNRILGCIPELTNIVYDTNRKGFSKKMHYKLMRSMYRKCFGNKVVFIDYPKKNLLSNQFNPKDIQYIAENFEITEREAKEYIKVIDAKELEKIREHFKTIEHYGEIEKEKLKKSEM